MSKSRPDASDILQDVSRETTERLQAYVAELLRWNKRINLISRATEGEVWQRHILDSAQIYDLAPESAASWLDFGSGAGLPGLVVAILAKEANPELKVTVVDSDTRKTVFLQTIAKQLDLATKIENARIENLPPQNSDVISARAVAPLSKLFDLAARHAHEKTMFLFPKGADHTSEIAVPGAHQNVPLRIVPSRVHPDGVILCFGGPGGETV